MWLPHTPQSLSWIQTEMPWEINRQQMDCTVERCLCFATNTPACKPADSTTKQNIRDFYGVIFSVLIQERVMPVWELDLLISCSDFMILSLKTLRLHSDTLYLHLDLLCFCLNCMPALRYSAVRNRFPVFEIKLWPLSCSCSLTKLLLSGFLSSNFTVRTWLRYKHEMHLTHIFFYTETKNFL